MNPQELLMNTTDSVCSPDINEAFQTLKELRSDQKSNTNNTAQLKKQLDDHQQRNEFLKQQIESNKR